MRIPLLLLFGVAAAASSQPQSTSAYDEAAMERYEAHATAVTGQVSRIRDQQPWAISAGERVPVRQIITTGPDGYGHFVVTGGSSFDVYANSRVAFRSNTATVGDLLDVIAGRARIHLQPAAGMQQERIFTPVAVISATQRATVALAVDEEGTVRIDVIEGEVRVQHTLLPRNEPTVVRAVDAIVVSRDRQISRQVDRGSLYRYTVRSLKDIWAAVTPGHSTGHSGDPIEQKFVSGNPRCDPSDFGY
ncbi:MAG: FecR domain-containing protein [Acidobacteriaceae bacterium]|nr:FecR domain-containing protein [Acidobacteriaceae bacterium]